uniref:Ileal sodium/bile acid cotransporter-like n=1 Tax=Strongyloides venezuelensis TaxID=75913 RepID=A0A0K0G012_STRVS
MKKCTVLLIIFLFSDVYGEDGKKIVNVDIVHTNEIRMKTTELLTLNFSTSKKPIDNYFKFSCRDPYLCYVDNNTTFINVKLDKNNNYKTNVSIKLHPTFLGVTNINVEPVNVSDIIIALNTTIKVHKTISGQRWENIFSLVVTYFITFVTFLMGTQLHLPIILEILKKPFGPIVSAVCQFVFMPLVAYSLCLTVLQDEPNVVKFCFIAAGSSPGGGKSSFWTIIFDGNLDLSVCLTFIQTLCASIMMPFWMKVLGEKFLASENIALPYMGLLKAILNLVIPCVIGMITVHYKPHLVKNAQKYIKTATWFSTIIFTALGVFVYYHIFLMITFPILVASCILPWSGYIVAFCFGKLCRLPMADVITLSIETGVQNVGLSVMMLMYSFKSPELDIAIVAPIVVILATDKPLVIIWLIKKAILKYKEKNVVREENIQLPTSPS